MFEKIRMAFTKSADRQRAQIAESADRMASNVSNRIAAAIKDNVHATSELAQTIRSQNGMERFVDDFRHRG